MLNVHHLNRPCLLSFRIKKSLLNDKAGQGSIKKIQQLDTADDSKIVRFHKNLLNLMIRTLGLDIYSVMWVQFLKGFGLGGLAIWLLMR